MRPKFSSPKTPGEKVVNDIRRATRKHYPAEDKVRIVLDGLRGEDSIAELYRREGIAQTTARRKQAVRMLKCECQAYGYTVRTARKWLATLGPPLCPMPDHGPMRHDPLDDEE